MLNSFLINCSIAFLPAFKCIKLSKLGFKALPKSQQRFILEEAIANLLGKKMDQQKKNEYINKED